MRTLAVAVATTALLVGVLAGVWFSRPNVVPSQEPTRLALNLDPRQHLSGGIGMEEMELGLQRPSRQSFVLSPDGRQLVYVASDGDTTQLYRRPLD